MTTIHLKIIALVTMIIDHTGYMIFPEFFILRLIGRISFPIYAFFIVEGIKYTSNIYNYIRRLLLLGIICQIGFYLSNIIGEGSSIDFKTLNILFTLSFGALGIYFYEKYKILNNNILKYSYLIGFMVFADLLNADYGKWGVLLIYIFYFLGTAPIVGILWVILKNNILAYMIVLPFNIFYIQDGMSVSEGIKILYSILEVSLFTMISFFIIDYYNKNKELNKNKLTSKQKSISQKFFYISYPLHFIILYIIKILINK